MSDPKQDGETECRHRHDPAGHHDHDLSNPGVAVLTVSSSRSSETDPAGDAIVARLESIESRSVVRDDREAIADALGCAIESTDAVVTSGGTGVTPDDVTVEVARKRFDKQLPGFGELFRRRSEAEIGERVMATRATAGIADETPVFCLPGSENAARVGADLLAPQLSHLVGLATR